MPKIPRPPKQLSISTSCNSDHWCIRQVHRPSLSDLAKKLANWSGEPREQQWLHQNLSLAVVGGNAASLATFWWALR